MSEAINEDPSDREDYRFFRLSPSLTKHLETPLPPKLWHYTSIQSVHSILESGVMRATDARFLNDREELIHAARFADSLIKQQPYDKSIVDFVQQHVAKTFDVLLSYENPHRNYVTCFTSRKDDLSQWRAYSAGSAGAGIAFDFRNSKLRNSIAPCIYRDEDKKQLLGEIFNEIFGVAKFHFQADPATLLLPNSELPPDVQKKFPWAKDNIKLATLRLLKPIITILPLLKDSSFEAEDEWRITRLASDSVELPQKIFYRPRKDAIVPYIELSITDDNNLLPIAELILGPGSHPDSADAMARYLKSRGIPVDPQHSRVPYRSTSP